MLMDNLDKLRPPIVVKPVPCLNCGNDRVEIHHYKTSQAKAPWRLVCQKCQNTASWFALLEDGIMEWNRRNTKQQ